MYETLLIRRATFRARHRYGLPGLDEAANRARFGDLVHAHAHDFRVEVRVSGPPEAGTGFTVDLTALDAALDGVLAPLRDSDLNEALPSVRDGREQPCTEVIARWIFRSLTPALPEPARLVEVAVFEDEALGAVVRASAD
ncbi:MAG: hypothetical protein D6701_00455 [Gemmatimonadetes bacterium]|nr:MAG: hypothetical protein D6701_00455 [Gemmatimonadota bacterium]